ncbi:hypothetical protein HYH03_000853 [Edaphochlamys debaryana]|uniref:Uncharacterized protein n=1 Tax=Edaphochlamys debaryana TaxID=47281 RepID=A0A835YNM5_9CHLO|nr:hypothetical protein HYH03_000853 [Edaphochlamys debaryana]|eukprot:KAG2501034.1 hypothetical protein HYH03_000853 [Edaphochlamys debaryana]
MGAAADQRPASLAAKRGRDRQEEEDLAVLRKARAVVAADPDPDMKAAAAAAIKFFEEFRAMLQGPQDGAGPSNAPNVTTNTTAAAASAPAPIAADLTPSGAAPGVPDQAGTSASGPGPTSATAADVGGPGQQGLERRRSGEEAAPGEGAGGAPVAGGAVGDGGQGTGAVGHGWGWGLGTLQLLRDKACGSALHYFYNLKPSLSQPQMLVVTELDDPFVPLPEDLLVNLRESRGAVDALLAALPGNFAGQAVVESAMGPALQAAFMVASHIGGKLLLFQSSVPFLGVGKVKNRDNPSAYGTEREPALRNPDDPFFKRYAAECSRVQLTVDVFAMSMQYCDLASIAAIPRYTCGELYHYPGFMAQRDGAKLTAEIAHNLTRPTAWEAVMRVRCSKGLRISAFHGHFFNRSTDLLALPRATRTRWGGGLGGAFAMEIAHEEGMVQPGFAYVQCALLYTNSNGERRIRPGRLLLWARGPAKRSGHSGHDSSVYAAAPQESKQQRRSGDERGPTGGGRGRTAGGPRPIEEGLLRAGMTGPEEQRPLAADTEGPRKGMHGPGMGQESERRRRRDEREPAADVITSTPSPPPFLAVTDTLRASAADARRLYQQASTVADTAYLLFGAAAPLSRAEGSSNALLPYLSPEIMRSYASRPGMCASTLVEKLYGLGIDLYGTSTLRACHYSLYTALGETFAWVRDNVPLRLQEVEGQPLAAAAWPDRTLVSDLELTAAVADALGDATKLGPTSEQLQAACGLHPTDFAALAPRISAALEGLHANLPILQGIAADLSADHRAADTAGRGHRRQRSALEDEASPTGQNSSAQELLRARRSLGTWPSNYIYNMPPNSSYKYAGPGAMPLLYVPLVVHVLTYRDSTGAIGPALWRSSPQLVDRAIRVLNVMAKPTNWQFYLKAGLPFSTTVVDWPRSINCYVSGDGSGGSNTLGYASGVPGSFTDPSRGFLFLRWDQFTPEGTNSLAGYNDGPNTLWHEILHHLGLAHPFGPGNSGSSCDDDDYVVDTPAAFGDVDHSSFRATAMSYCMEIFWKKYAGDWPGTYDRWSKALEIPLEDRNSWADSCPNNPGYDEIGNYLTYNTAVCFAALGHLTREQAERAHLVTAELNPVLYAWGQHYAQNSQNLPQRQWPDLTETAPNVCRMTYKSRASPSGCACKSSWTYGGKTYSYCARLPDDDQATVFCQVADTSSCAACSGSFCVLGCQGTASVCDPLPGTQPPPSPPLPPSPPPMPPPPPPKDYPAECMAAPSATPSSATSATSTPTSTTG